MTNYYEVLEIEKNASEDDIKKAYKKLALKWHPDKNPNNREEAEEKFKAVAEAYSILSDSEKKRMYDSTGSVDENMCNSAPGGFSNEHSNFPGFFHQTFSFGPGVRTAHFSSNSSSGVDPRKLFEEFFGNADPFSEMKRSTAPSRFDEFIEQSPKPEPILRVQKIPFSLEELYCGCNKKLKINKIMLDMNVMPGWKDGEGVTYSGVIPDAKLKLAVEELPHNIFTRDDSNLHTTLRITYTEALNGFTKQITKLDGTLLTISLPKIKSSDYVHIIKSEGMPIRKDKKQVGFGELHVNFIVTF